jgi:hypothetical protein
MAYNQFDVAAETVPLTGTTTQTVVGLQASTNVCVKITEASISFDGAVSGNAPAVCEFDQITFATNAPGTNSTAVIPSKRDTGRAETIQATAAKHWTVQPTIITLQWCIDVGQFNGLYHFIHPFASPFICIGGKGCGITITSPNAVNYSGKLTGEE